MMEKALWEEIGNIKSRLKALEARAGINTQMDAMAICDEKGVLKPGPISNFEDLLMRVAGETAPTMNDVPEA